MHFPVHLPLRPSRLLSFFLIGAHALAATCILAVAATVDLPSTLKVVSVLALLVLFLFSLRYSLARSIVESLTIGSHERLSCQLKSGVTAPARVLPDSTVFPGLVVLRLEIQDYGKCAIVLLPDCLPPGRLRRLRLWLRWRNQVMPEVGGA